MAFCFKFIYQSDFIYKLFIGLSFKVIIIEYVLIRVDKTIIKKQIL